MEYMYMPYTSFSSGLPPYVNRFSQLDDQNKLESFVTVDDEILKRISKKNISVGMSSKCL